MYPDHVRGICQICGFEFRRNHIVRQWDGILACKGPGTNNCWSARHPQDFVRAVPDKQSVPNPAPEPADTYIDLVLDGSDLTSSNWDSTNVTTVADQAEDGAHVTRLDTLHDGTANAQHFIAQDISSTAAKSYAISGTVRAKDHTWFQVGGGSAVWGTTFWANFQATGDGNVGNKGADVTSALITAIGNDCYRFSIVGTATTTASDDAIFIALINNTDTISRLPTYAGSSAGLYFGDISYMPTTSDL